jgi:uncharacterized protein (TIGR03066 family)
MRSLGLALMACVVLALSACSGDTGKDKGKGQDGKHGKDSQGKDRKSGEDGKDGKGKGGTNGEGGKAKDGKNGKESSSKSNAAKLIGTWEFVKAEDKAAAPPTGTTFEFTKDGKQIRTMPLPGVDKPSKVEAAYKVEGDKILVTSKDPGGKEKTVSAPIKKLTDDTLIIEQDGKAVEFKRKK